MNKAKLFVENFLVYGLGGIISKVIPLVMIPFVTRLMPDSKYFGISDLSSTIVSFGSAVAVMGMYDAMYRMFFEKEDEEYKKRVCSTTLVFTLGTSFVVFVVILLCRNVIAEIFFNGLEYAYVVNISAVAALVSATNSIISAPTRMRNKRKVFIMTNTFGSIISYGIAIFLLLDGHYVVALPLASVIAGVTIELAFGILNREWFDSKCVDVALLRPMVRLAIPLLPNFLIYWIFNSCDKVMITNLMGVGAAGVYAVGSKLGHASQLVYTAFAGGWQYFAFTTMKEENQVETNSKVFEYLGIISFIATAFICALSKPIFEILFEEEYIMGYIVAPYLFMAPLLQMLFQVAGNQFLVVKKTGPNMIFLSCGAVANIVINLKLIPLWGIEGAAVATLAGYVISIALCISVLCKLKLMIVSRRICYSATVMVGYMVLWRVMFYDRPLLGIMQAAVFTVIIVTIYKEEMLGILNAMWKKRGSKL